MKQKHDKQNYAKIQFNLFLSTPPPPIWGCNANKTSTSLTFRRRTVQMVSKLCLKDSRSVVVWMWGTWKHGWRSPCPRRAKAQENSLQQEQGKHRKRSQVLKTYKEQLSLQDPKQVQRQPEPLSEPSAVRNIKSNTIML